MKRKAKKAEVVPKDSNKDSDTRKEQKEVVGGGYLFLTNQAWLTLKTHTVREGQREGEGEGEGEKSNLAVPIIEED